jgi:hypothetical protein
MARGNWFDLHPDPRDQSRFLPQLPRNAARTGMGVRFVQRLDDNVYVIAEHASLLAVERKTVDYRQCIRGNGRSQPLDDVAVIVVVRWLDQDQREAFARTLVSSHGKRSQAERRSMQKYTNLRADRIHNCEG